MTEKQSCQATSFACIFWCALMLVLGQTAMYSDGQLPIKEQTFSGELEGVEPGNESCEACDAPTRVLVRQ